MKRNLLLIVWSITYVIILTGCRHANPQPQPTPTAPDYASAENWFEGESIDPTKKYDVFYIVPTCVFDWTDETGNVCHYMDVHNVSHRQQVSGPLHLARGIFADEANFFAPYYRQITLESWMESDSVIESRFQLAYNDIQAAFHYFIEHLNQGRPFILAGHSQGGKAVIELLKREMTDETYHRMIAAYPLGYPVRTTDVSPYMVPATDARSTGVFVTFNSVSSPDRLPPLLSGSRAAINPLNWRTDTVTAPASDHLGSVFMSSDGTITSEEQHVLSARLDTATQALIVSGADPMKYYVPSLADLFPPGNYHVVELNFFYRNLQQNVKQRAKTYFGRTATLYNHQKQEIGMSSTAR